MTIDEQNRKLFGDSLNTCLSQINTHANNGSEELVKLWLDMASGLARQRVAEVRKLEGGPLPTLTR